MHGIFPVTINLWKISCRMGANSLCNVCRTMGLNLSGPAALCGSKHTSTCQCLERICLYQAFLDGDLAGMVGWPQSRDITHIICAFCRVGGSNHLPLLKLKLL